MSSLADEVAAHGGAAAPASATARLRDVLDATLRHGAAELAKTRSGYGAPVEVAFAAGAGVLLAATPADAALRADPDAIDERSWLLVAATVAALTDAIGGAPPASAADLALTAGDLAGRLTVAMPARGADPELAALAFDEHVTGIDRLRARAAALPPRVLEPPDLRPPIGEHHPLRVAEAVARLGGRPQDPESVEALEDAVLAVLGSSGGAAVRPHEEPDPALRVARRILQRLDGMGKWGGYHTEFAHLPRGFAGNERALATAVGEALLEAGLLAEKPSVGQRHVFLNPRRAGDIRRMVDMGDVPSGMKLPTV